MLAKFLRGLFTPVQPTKPATPNTITPPKEEKQSTVESIQSYKESIQPIDSSPLSVDKYFGDMPTKFAAEYKPEFRQSAETLLLRVKLLLTTIGVNQRNINSGWRPSSYNATVKGAASKSKHCTGCAVDLADADKLLAGAIMRQKSVLTTCNLYIEDPNYTKTWVHFQTVPPGSGRRIFIP